MPANPDSSLTTFVLIIASVLLFVASFWSARTLMGTRAATTFAALALPIGWFAEEMGSSRGWFFGQYSYTDVLGPKLGNVPLVIPLMWFGLTWVASVMASLILWRTPVAENRTSRHKVIIALLAAMIVTAFDLGADPYFIRVLHAWIMQKTNGGWFGETRKGFVGWMFVSFVIVMGLLQQARPAVTQPVPRKTRLAALVPMIVYGGFTVFQWVFGDPIETRPVAFFAIGIPLLAALVAWQRWPQEPATQKATPQAAWPLDEMNMLADPLADNTVSAIMETTGGDGGDATALAQSGQASKWMGQWRSNGELPDWTPADAQADPAVAQCLQAYLAQGSALPEWADRAKIGRAEALFMDQGPLSCALLFCASLPQCYVLPHLAEVLHIAGQLEAHTEYRVRQTAAMIFPVMMKGGLTDPDGTGISQVLKVRLVHATIRNLVLHGNPAAVRGVVAPGAGVGPQGGMNQALMAHGWDVPANGLPCSQVDLAYTLLTFGYVFLKGMRTMGLYLSQEDEEAYLHTWNVMGHVLGIRDELLAHSMEDAALQFERIQAWGRARPTQTDVRPGLGKALVGALARAIQVPVVQRIPVPMTRWLIGSRAARDIGVNLRVSWWTRLLFGTGRFLAACVDGVLGLIWPEFSLSRMLTRVIGYHMLTHFLLDQTRPIGLPEKTLNPMRSTMAAWSSDTRAPPWLQSLERSLTSQQAWGQPAAAARPVN